MKLLFDARYIRTDFHDGISRYSAELANALADITPVTFLVCDARQTEHLPPDSKTITIHKPTSPREPFTSLLLNKYQPDVVFSPMQTMGSIGRRFKLILTLHDLIYYRHRTPPQHLSPLIRLGWRAYHVTYTPQRLTLNRADAVATVSNTSRVDILQSRLTRRPIVVVPNAARDLNHHLDKPIDLSEPPRNLIYMGSFMNYKNVEALIAGMSFLPNHDLHLLSRISSKRKAELQKQVPNGARVQFHNGINDKDYAKILSKNAALVSASRDEGYGLPVVEAMQLGVPAVVSDIEIHREVAGKGALYFPTSNPQMFAKQVLELDDHKLRYSLVKRGHEHIKKFSWSDSAQTLLQAASELIE